MSSQPTFNVELNGPLFVYGALTFSNILSLVTQEPALHYETAFLRGWRIAPLEEVNYPALVQDENSSAVGCLVTGLSNVAWERLDAWEDDAYSLTLVTVNIPRTAGIPSKAPKKGAVPSDKNSFYDKVDALTYIAKTDGFNYTVQNGVWQREKWAAANLTALSDQLKAQSHV